MAVGSPDCLKFHYVDIKKKLVKLSEYYTESNQKKNCVDVENLTEQNKNNWTLGIMSAGGSCRFLPPFTQQHMAKQMAMISSDTANEPDAIIIIGNFPVKWM